MNENTLNSFKKIFKGKNILLTIILIAAGISLVFLSSGKDSGSKPQESISSVFNEQEYISNLERKLETLILQIAGINTADVMITLESGPIYSYIKDTDESTSQTSSDKRQEIVFSSKSSSVKEPITETVYSPKINGAAIVCTNGDNASVQEKIIGIVSSVLNLSTNRIFVTN